MPTRTSGRGSSRGETATETHLEKHFSPAQLGALWSLSSDFIRNQFRDEPGVLRIDRPEEMHKREYCLLRIPQSVVCRVHCRLQAGK